MPINSKKKGNAYECKIAVELRDLGFEGAVTSRYASKKRDDEKVDLMHTEPFNVQCKAWKSAPNLHIELSKMPKDGNYNVIFHKRPYKGDIVAMTKEDFYELLKLLKVEGVI